MTELTENKTHVCSHRHSTMLDNGVRRLLQNPKKILSGYVNPSDTVVDFGCGPGFFTVELAKMTGKSGQVFALDLQPEMLEKMMQKAKRHGFENRITPHLCQAEDINLPLSTPVDFILAYYVIHETPSAQKCLGQLKGLLKPGGRLLIVEPLFHVSKTDFKNLQEIAIQAGFKTLKRKTNLSGRSLLLTV